MKVWLFTQDQLDAAIRAFFHHTPGSELPADPSRLIERFLLSDTHKLAMDVMPFRDEAVKP